jgi:hypothetical protein
MRRRVVGIVNQTIVSVGQCCCASASLGKAESGVLGDRAREAPANATSPTKAPTIARNLSSADGLIISDGAASSGEIRRRVGLGAMGEVKSQARFDATHPWSTKRQRLPGAVWSHLRSLDRRPLTIEQPSSGMPSAARRRPAIPATRRSAQRGPSPRRPVRNRRLSRLHQTPARTTADAERAASHGSCLCSSAYVRWRDHRSRQPLFYAAPDLRRDAGAVVTPGGVVNAVCSDIISRPVGDFPGIGNLAEHLDVFHCLLNSSSRELLPQQRRALPNKTRRRSTRDSNSRSLSRGSCFFSRRRRDRRSISGWSRRASPFSRGPSGSNPSRSG